MIQLYTATTPNCWKVSICLEEMSIPYQVKAVDLPALEQKEDWYLEICPNGRVPAIVDGDNDNFVIFESGAILLYLAERSGMLLPPGERERSVAIQWLMFQMGGVGPIQGQLLVFERNAPERIPVRSRPLPKRDNPSLQRARQAIGRRRVSGGRLQHRGHRQLDLDFSRSLVRY